MRRIKNRAIAMALAVALGVSSVSAGVNAAEMPQDGTVAVTETAEEAAEEALEATGEAAEEALEATGEAAEVMPEAAEVTEDTASGESGDVMPETADGKVALTPENFPDANFLEALKDSVAISGDEGYADINTTDITVDGKDIKSLEGIEKFTNLVSLRCSGNELTGLDLSQNTKLEILNCEYNQISEIDLSKNKELEFLYISSNNLESLDVGSNVNLREIGCNYNDLGTLDLSNNRALQKVFCRGNRLTSLELPGDPELTYLDCQENQLTSVDFGLTGVETYTNFNNVKLYQTLDQALDKAVTVEPGKHYTSADQAIQLSTPYYYESKNYQDLSCYRSGDARLYKVTVPANTAYSLVFDTTVNADVEFFASSDFNRRSDYHDCDENVTGVENSAPCYGHKLENTTSGSVDYYMAIYSADETPEFTIVSGDSEQLSESLFTEIGLGQNALPADKHYVKFKKIKYYEAEQPAESATETDTANAYLLKFTVPEGKVYRLSPVTEAAGQSCSMEYYTYVSGADAYYFAGKYGEYDVLHSCFYGGSTYYVFVKTDGIKLSLKEQQTLGDIKNGATVISAGGEYKAAVTDESYYYRQYSGRASYGVGSLYKVSVPAGAGYNFTTSGTTTIFDSELNEPLTTGSCKSEIINEESDEQTYYIWVAANEAGEQDTETSIEAEKVSTLKECIDELGSKIETIELEKTIEYNGKTGNNVNCIARDVNEYDYYKGRLYKLDGGYYTVSSVGDGVISGLDYAIMYICDENLEMHYKIALVSGGKMDIQLSYGETYYVILANTDYTWSVTLTDTTEKLWESAGNAVSLNSGKNTTWIDEEKGNDDRKLYRYILKNSEQPEYRVLGQSILYKCEVPANCGVNVGISGINNLEGDGEVLVFDDLADVPKASYSLATGEAEFKYENSSNADKTIYLLMGGAYYINDNATINLEVLSEWETHCIDGNYAIAVGSDMKINLSGLKDNGFSGSCFKGLDESEGNGTYNEDDESITVDDLDKVVKYKYAVGDTEKTLKFVPYQKTDKEFNESQTVKVVEEEDKPDETTGGTTTTSLEVTKGGKITGKVAETVIYVKPAGASDDAKVVVTEKKDAAGSTVNESAIEVTQNAISTDALYTSLEVLEKKNKEYQKDEQKVTVSIVTASFKDDTSAASIDKTVINKLKETGAELRISKVDEKGEVGYTWTFAGEIIEKSGKELTINAKISVIGKNDAYQERTLLNKISGAGADNCVLSFAHSGLLPGATDVSVSVSNKYNEGQKLKYYYFNKSANKLEYCGETVVKDGFVAIKIEHCSDYVLTDKAPAEKTEEPKTEEPKTEEPKTEEPKTEEPKTEEPKTEEPKTEEPKTEEPKTEEPKAEEPKAEEPVAAVAPDVTVSYKTHIQSFGTEKAWSTNGAVSGTSGKAKRLEAIYMNVSGNDSLGIQYTTHCQSYGWLAWSSNGEMSGTEGEAKRLEAIKIQLTGADKDKYDVYYRVHAQSYGWLNWAKNGEPAGTAGYAKRLEAIQVVVVRKGESIDTSMGGITSKQAAAYVSQSGSAVTVGGSDTTNVVYRTHVQTYGWQGWKYNGAVSGTTGEAKRLEGIKIKLANKQYSGGITYRTHIQTYGWEKVWRNDGEMSGTTGEAKRLEAIQIQLTGEMAEHYDVYYRVHAQSYGWLGWAKNGESAGTAGYAKRLEGIQIVLVPKGSEAPSASYGGVTSKTATSYVQK